MENSLSNYPVVDAFQKITQPLITPLAKGCRWDIDISRIAARNGLESISAPITTSLGTIILNIYHKVTVN